MCGHSHCGGDGRAEVGRRPVRAARRGRLAPAGPPELAPVLTTASDDPSLPDVAQGNVVNQLAVLRTYPVVRQRLDGGRLRLHGWYYEVDTGQVHELAGDGLFRVHTG